MKQIVLILLSALIISTHGFIEIENGKISGTEFPKYFAYRGIKYATAERFEQCKPFVTKWSEVKEFNNYGESCAQYDHLTYTFFGSEDCLLLNVFVPKKVLESNELAPVLFYIHGGAFMFGESSYYLPDHIMENEKMILVTINYRLGILGFLSTEDEVLPGNLGLKDQVEALKWVQRNIKAFNGNPNKVTLIGFSAGGASVQLHYLSPLSDGLFNNGISVSGVALNPWVFMEKARDKSYKIAKYLDCPHDNHKAMIQCLKQQNVEQLASLASKFQPFLYNPFSPFGAAIEPSHDSAFISDDPRELLKKGKYSRKPWLLSQTKDEGLYPAAEFYSKDDYLKEIDENWEKIIPYILHYNDETDDQRKIDDASKTIRKNYMDDRKVNRKNFMIFDNIITDRLFKYNAYEAIQLQSKYSPSYFYHFNYKSLAGVAEEMSNSTDFIGISHGEDIFLIFNSKIRHIDFSEDEKKMAQNLIQMFYEFSINDVPKFDRQIINRSYPDAIQTLEIYSNTKYAMKMQDENFGNVKFWTRINKILHPIERKADEL